MSPLREGCLKLFPQREGQEVGVKPISVVDIICEVGSLKGYDRGYPFILIPETDQSIGIILGVFLQRLRIACIDAPPESLIDALEGGAGRPDIGVRIEHIALEGKRKGVEYILAAPHLLESIGSIE